MSNLRRFVAVLQVLCVVQCFAMSSFAHEGYDDWFYDVGRPSSASEKTVKCKKDLLLIIDASYSVGRSSFERDVKPFLERLVTDRVLNVGLDGTQMALMIFSQEERTKMLLNFGDIYNAEELAMYVRNLKWDDVKGDKTRTDLALKIANEKVFPANNPRNNRPNVDDVIVLITDGAPHGRHNTKDEAIKYAGMLKDKSVLVVGAAVGSNRNKFKEILKKLATSDKYVLEADFKEMDEILAKLVASSCIKPGQCLCHEMRSSTIYVKPGLSKAMVEWPEPQFSCMTGRKPVVTSSIVEPRVTSPHPFSVGKHTIVYTYKLKGGVNVVCPVNFNVKGELCRGRVFNSKAQVCCCGSIHARKSNHGCCGPDYYNMHNHRCCPNANLVSRQESCPRE